MRQVLRTQFPNLFPNYVLLITTFLKVLSFENPYCDLLMLYKEQILLLFMPVRYELDNCSE